MWDIVLALIIILLVAFVCYTQNGRRAAPSVFLGIAAGLVVLLVTCAGMMKITIPTPAEIGSITILYIGIAVEIALGVYIALMSATRTQVIIETVPK